MDEQTRTELEAAAFRTLVDHLRENTEVQNIDLMNLAGFCRNCLSKWYRAAAEDRNIEMSYDDAREVIYGMPYSEWKDKHQKEASPDQLAAFQKNAESGAERVRGSTGCNQDGIGTYTYGTSFQDTVSD